MNLDIWYILFLSIPAFLGNSAPVFVAKLPYLRNWDTPIDGGKTFRNKPILGKNKTWRGFFAAGFFGLLGGGFMLWMDLQITQYELFPASTTYLTYGMLCGFAAISGDVIESFAKRQLNIASGNPWIPFDYIDYIVTFLPISALWITWTWPEAIFLLVFVCILNPISNFIGWCIGIKKTWK